MISAPQPEGGIVIDTNVFGARLAPARAALADQYAPLLLGREAYISFVTVAELRFGSRRAGWGNSRVRRLESHVASATVVWPGETMVDAYAKLRHACVTIGHGLSQKEHEADRWIAATALWLGLPLVAHDGIFREVPELHLITRLAEP